VNAPASIWQRPGFRAYLESTAFSGMAFAMQQLLVSWLLIGVLHEPAGRVGLLQALIGVPGIFLMLWGGASADRQDPRGLLVTVYALAPILPLALIAAEQTYGLTVWAVTAWGVGMSVAVSFTSPAQQAILNRVSGSAIQQAVSASTGVGFLVQITGLAVAGQMERIGLTAVLVVQAVCLAIGALMIRRIAAHAPPQTGTRSPLANVLDGLKVTWRHKTILHVLVINFVSTIFNAGAFMTVFPFIVKRVYDGDALVLAFLMGVFYLGATAANFLMFRQMPFARPGRLFLLMQLTRIVVLFLLWIEPSWPLLVVATAAWGVNMGYTTTLARTIVQESAEADYRGRILSVFTLGMMGSAPLGAILLGWIIEAWGTLQALVPAMVVSALLCAAGILFTGLWRYESPTVHD
jgi:predicted MFS family arabinose efflux permease